VIDSAGGHIAIYDFTVENNHRTPKSNGYGIMIRDTDNVTLTNGKVYDGRGAKKQWGVRIEGDSDYIVISGCDLRGNLDDVNLSIEEGANLNGEIRDSLSN
jgi:hypothetical protein